ncbi:MAG: hypothetical protein LKM32_09480 [Chiayiivirga sp.]|jgi:hypothetical protein|uniref:hypothetical protein n=1 Tax=Chiayiivirga sp. TaxID=2041042 RepID=UPI0025BC47C2|nr:hypothetical protein [Chiayiivirga sp.]MCI1711829.1 hypothetical protein [Chiayiivirga sp.]MCI1729586.1 hypothetical protein [Chiayiivirga sp.]
MTTPTAGSRLTWLVLFAALASTAVAQPRASHVTRPNPEQRLVLSSEGMLRGHPDLRWRQAGLLEMERGNEGLARAYLTRAAHYADKPAQAMLAELLWNAPAPQRAQAYAWMDLAAERGYVVFVAHREKYWKAMDRHEREAALALGQGLYAGFGDAVAQPRLEKVLARANRQRTGSRTGGSTLARVYAAPAYGASGTVIDASLGRVYLGAELPDFHAARYWKPRDYWQWQDQQFNGVPEEWRKAAVEVGDLEADGSGRNP